MESSPAHLGESAARLLRFLPHYRDLLGRRDIPPWLPLRILIQPEMVADIPFLCREPVTSAHNYFFLPFFAAVMDFFNADAISAESVATWAGPGM